MRWATSRSWWVQVPRPGRPYGLLRRCDGQVLTEDKSFDSHATNA